MSDPWSDRAVEVTVSAPLAFAGTATDPRAGDPLFLTLADGSRCTIMGGATYSLAGLRANYSCNRGGTAFGSPDRTNRRWTITFGTGDGSDLVDTFITRVWF